MGKICHTCNLHIALNLLPIVCKGFCTEERYYHAECVGLSHLEHHACYHPNLLWMCDPCRELMLNPKFRNTVNGLRTAERSGESGVEDLRTEVSKLNESMNQLMEKLHKAGTVTSLSTSTSQDSTSNGEQLLSSTVLHEDDSVNRASIEEKPRFRIASRTLNERKLTLHLSNIANDVTEQEVAEMVADVCETEHAPVVQLLVPSWKDKSSLQYISFKVEIDASLRFKALRTSLWPDGVRCREFRDFPRNV